MAENASNIATVKAKIIHMHDSAQHNRSQSPLLVWDDDHVKALLRLLRSPFRRLHDEPWSTWIQQRGGLAAIHHALRHCPDLTADQHDVLAIILDHPYQAAEIYADKLHIDRSTYFVRLRDVVTMIRHYLNGWSSDTSPSANMPDPIGSHLHAQRPLPVPTTSLIGRDHVIADICTLLQRADVRLVTLTGPGGIGKTRLSLAVATALATVFADGVGFVSLAALTNPELVPAEIALALGLPEISKQAPFEQLVSTLRSRHFLLVVDNFEHLIDAALTLGALLSAAPRLAILVTSREVLRIAGEYEYPVIPLAVPENTAGITRDQVLAAPAARLFIERVHAINPAFTVSDDDAPLVADICNQLDGLPLAIELAAARSKVLALPALHARLQRRLALLTNGPRDLPARHQTLRATIDWSYTLLRSEEQTLFAWLAVFVGGWTLEAAEAICQLPPSLHIDVLDGLSSLVDKSLVLRAGTHEGSFRFTMLETLREYALEVLTTSGAWNLVAQRHTHYYLTLARDAGTLLQSAEKDRAIAQLEHEHDNVRAALQRAIADHNGTIALQIVTTLWPFWRTHNHIDEGRRWIATALAIAATADPGLRADALFAAGLLAFDQSDYLHARALFHDCLAIRRTIGEPGGIAEALMHLGNVATYLGDYPEGQRLLEESLTLQRMRNHTEGIATALHYLGIVHRYTNDVRQAQTLLEESLVLFQHLGNAHACAWVLNELAAVTLILQDAPQATVCCEQSLALLSRYHIKDNRATGFALIILALVAYYGADYERALALNMENGLLHYEVGNKDGIAWYLLILSWLMAAVGKHCEATCLFGAITALLARSHHPLSPAAQVAWEEHMARTRAILDEPTWSAAWDEGMGMVDEQLRVFAQACEHELQNTLLLKESPQDEDGDNEHTSQ